MNFAILQFTDESVETRTNIRDLRLSFPMPLGREVNDITRIEHYTTIENVHSTWNEFTLAANSFIFGNHLRERFLELQRNSLSHHTDGIHGVYQGFSVSLQEIARYD